MLVEERIEKIQADWDPTGQEGKSTATNKLVSSMLNETWDNQSQVGITLQAASDLNEATTTSDYISQEA